MNAADAVSCDRIVLLSDFPILAKVGSQVPDRRAVPHRKRFEGIALQLFDRRGAVRTRASSSNNGSGRSTPLPGPIPPSSESPPGCPRCFVRVAILPAGFRAVSPTTPCAARFFPTDPDVRFLDQGFWRFASTHVRKRIKFRVISPRPPSSGEAYREIGSRRGTACRRQPWHRFQTSEWRDSWRLCRR